MAAPEAELVLKWEREQAHLRESVKEEDTEDWQRSPDFSGLERVGGVDLSFIKGDDINACAHLVVLTYPHMKVLYEDCKMVTLNAPYVAGFLGFREAPPLLQALEKLKNIQPNLMPQTFIYSHSLLFASRSECSPNVSLKLLLQVILPLHSSYQTHPATIPTSLLFSLTYSSEPTSITFEAISEPIVSDPVYTWYNAFPVTR
ncbi:endonuclease V-like isoform X4 [Onychostoma macrolepis]|uniref:endonuclease V-like isoform X4 n=1 Tax=Onychostoma macrolepis TaxID=369639 RepID=UPI002729EC70|nr:endonuclease V-like isoform X4 [Onychostoma macrolepis]